MLCGTATYLGMAILYKFSPPLLEKNCLLFASLEKRSQSVPWWPFAALVSRDILCLSTNPNIGEISSISKSHLSPGHWGMGKTGAKAAQKPGYLPQEEPSAVHECSLEPWSSPRITLNLQMTELNSLGILGGWTVWDHISAEFPLHSSLCPSQVLPPNFQELPNQKACKPCNLRFRQQHKLWGISASFLRGMST